MANLIGKIARNRNCGVIFEGGFSNPAGCDSTLSSCAGTGNCHSRRALDYESNLGRGISAQMGTTGRQRMSPASLELHSFRTGGDVDDHLAGFVERPWFGSDADTLVMPSASYNSRAGIVLDAPRELYHYGS